MKQFFRAFSPSVFLFYCLWLVTCPESGASQIYHEIAESLVSFDMNVVSPGKARCQGVRLSESLVVTSPYCAQEIKSALNKDRNVGVFDAQINTVGSLSLSNVTLPAPMSESGFFLVMDSNDGCHARPAYYTDTNLPEEAFATYINNQYAVSRVEVFLAVPDSSHSKHVFTFDAKEPDAKLPQGTPVYDGHGNMVCLITSKNKCRVLPASYTTLNHTDGFLEYVPGIALTAGVVILLGVVIKGGAVFRAVIPIVFSFLWSVSMYLLSSPRSQCLIGGGCETGQCNGCMH